MTYQLIPGTRMPGPDNEERARRADAVARQRSSPRARTMATSNRLAYLRTQLRVVARLSARVAATQDIEEMARIVVDELHETFAFYLAAIHRLDDDGMLRLVAGAGPLAEVMTEFVLVEAPLHVGVNGRVARSGATALVDDTRLDPDYVGRDEETDPRSELAVPIVADDRVWGVVNLEAVERHAFDEADAALVEAIAAGLGVAIHRASLVGELERAFMDVLGALTTTVEAKDGPTAMHGGEVARLAERVALRMGLAPDQARDVRHAAMLHDVGKVAVPSEILLKPGPLTREEWQVMRQHVVVGSQLLERVEAFRHLAPIVRASHERFDGKGYPDGLSGEGIPLAARIVAACDTYDAIVTERPYRPAASRETAIAELRRVAGRQLDDRVVIALLAEIV
ncbi:MAG: GAF domain-containing protein [Solirubrobacterales bacterium]|nr:GAF domain-containing protein [Solirubrobacterales bacterium]